MIDFEQMTTGRHKILVIDDEHDVHVITQMTLKSLTFQQRGVEIICARSAREGLDLLSRVPNIAVVLLDVVMESDMSGLDACEEIRRQQGNPFVRILLRTGRPGAAPERDVIHRHDIDGYLHKGDLTSARLYSTVRASLKAYGELVKLEYRRRAFERIDDAMLSLRPYQSIETIIEQINGTAAEVLRSPEVVLHLKLPMYETGSREYSLCDAPDLRSEEADLRVTHLRRRVSGFVLEPDSRLRFEGVHEPEIFDNGLLARFQLDHGLGDGWIFVRLGDRDRFSRHCLRLIARHACNCLYGAVAQRQMEEASLPAAM